MLSAPSRFLLIVFLLKASFFSVAAAGLSDSSITALTLQLNGHLKEDDKQNAVQDYLKIASSYSRLGNSKDAMAALFSALALTENTGDKKETAHCLYKIAVLYDRQDDPRHALIYAGKGLKIATAINDSTLTASCLHRMGLALASLKRYDEAMNDLEHSLAIRKSLGSKSGIGACLNAMGLIAMEQKEYSKALFDMNNAYALWKEAGDKEGIAIATGNLCSLYYTLNDYKKSQEYGIISYEQANAIHSYVFMKEACLTLSNAFEKDKDFEHAHFYFKRYAELKDTLINEESNQRIALIQSQFESDKQQQQISSLENEKSQQDRLRNLLIAGIGLVILLVLVVLNRYRVKQKANLLLQEANDEITTQKQEITDSIRYAKRLQEALLPADKVVKKLLPSSFILYKPKDIVSGDFYWLEQLDHKLFVAAVDCTGHGVPGAFMSILGYGQLSRAVNELGLSTPALILNELNKGVSKLLRQNKEERSMKDGMDIALLSLDLENKKLEFAGAFNPLYLIRNNELRIILGDKFPVGGFIDEELRTFTGHEIDLLPGDAIYICTDGYADQFGGPKGKKFKYKQLQELLLAIHQLPPEVQKQKLDEELERWKDWVVPGRPKGVEQIDDILLIGIKI